jgi:hypothetical protein
MDDASHTAEPNSGAAATDLSSVRKLAETLVIVIFLGIISLPLAGKLLPTEGAFALT